VTHPCLACLGEGAGEGGYHEDCSRRIFGSRSAPLVDVELGRLHTLALAMVGRTSLSGVQRKISLGLSADRMTLQLAAAGARYILKPQAQAYPALPENEHLTMQLAAASGLEVPPNALVRLRDGSLAYLAVRFDRPEGGGKLRQEDFCQLAGKLPKEKYDASAELCARIVRRHASEPGVEMLKLYRLLVFSWWVANGDAHLKNLSLLTGRDGRHALAPAYDQLCTRLVIPDDVLALPVGGKKDHLTRRTWLDFAEYCGLPPRAAGRVLARQAGVLGPALRLLARSPLPDEMKQACEDVLRERTAELAAG